MAQVTPARRLMGLPQISIWEEMTPLATQHKAINLGQGFPSFCPPTFLLDELQKVITDVNPLNHQYCPVRGHGELVNQLKCMYSTQLKRDILPTEVVVTNGVTQGLNAVMQAFVNEGDEIILIEPYFDAYFQDVQVSGGVAKFVQLRPSKVSADEWVLDEAQLLSAVSERTRLLILNTPQNVPGKVWSRDEMEMIARIARDNDIIVIADEVYMNLTYSKKHISLASLPGMWERTITLCSAGKTFSCTGWKIGWAISCETLTAPIAKILSYQTFCCSTPTQIALARALEAAQRNGYYDSLRSEYLRRQTLLSDLLTKCGLPPVKANGGFFLMADISNVDPSHYFNPDDRDYAKDWQFCRWLTKTIGVCAIPTTAFCNPSSRSTYEGFVRFACCKPEDDLLEAARRLERLKDYLIN